MANFIKSLEEFSRKANLFQIKTERDFSVPPKQFEGQKRLSFYIRIFLDLDTNRIKDSSTSSYFTLDDVKLVSYALHKSYHQPIRVSEDKHHNFEVKVWSYGYFPIRATVLLKMGKSLELEGHLKFPITEEEKEKIKHLMG